MPTRALRTRITPRTLACTAAVLVSALTGNVSAQAAPNDLALERLTFYDPTSPQAPGAGSVFQAGCGTASAQWARCFADEQLWSQLVAQLGTAIAPTIATPAEVGGRQRITLSLETTLTLIDPNSEAWKRGTYGNAGSTQQRTDTPGALGLTRFHIRKGLPWGFEIGARLGSIHASGLWVMGADIRLAVLESFTRGAARFLPDIAVRIGLDGIVSHSNVSLAVIAVDVTASKPFVLASQLRLIPSVALQALTSVGSASSIDATPSRSAYDECPRTMLDTSTTPPREVCVGGAGIPPGASPDFENVVSFGPTVVFRPRLSAGLRVQWNVLTAGIDAAFDISPAVLVDQAGSAQRGRPDSVTGMRRAPTMEPFFQWSFGLNVGVRL